MRELPTSEGEIEKKLRVVIYDLCVCVHVGRIQILPPNSKEERGFHCRGK